MKILKYILAAALFFSLAFGITACNREIRQQLDYNESTEIILNPDIGFYRPIFVKLDGGGATCNKNIVNDNAALYHLRTDISAFSARAGGQDEKFTAEALDGFEGLLSYLESRGKSAIIRLAYAPNFGNVADAEPDIELIKTHIRQICSKINLYYQTVTAIEVGLIGPWGEMHTSAMANAEVISALCEEYLTYARGLPILVRTPKMIYDYLGTTRDKVSEVEIKEGDKAYRLGLFNDGYLGSDTDLGTYTDREKEIPFLKRLTDHLPYGGEVVSPGSTLHDIENCTPEMYEMNLSYLNIEWNNNVIDKWKNTLYTSACGDDSLYYGKSAFDYIQNRLGYRFVLKDSVITDGIIKIKIDNVGFGNLTKKKYARLIITDEKDAVIKREEPVEFTGQGEMLFRLPQDKKGKKVYLQIFGNEKDGALNYAVQFANNGIWNEDLKSNLIALM